MGVGFVFFLLFTTISLFAYLSVWLTLPVLYVGIRTFFPVLSKRIREIASVRSFLVFSIAQYASRTTHHDFGTWFAMTSEEGHKVSINNGLMMVSVVRTVTLL